MAGAAHPGNAEEDRTMGWMDGREPPEEHQPPRRGDSGGVLIREDCPDCQGRGGFHYVPAYGEPYDETCETCKGTGEIETEDVPEWDD